jgi:hypothetical protein
VSWLHVGYHALELPAQATALLSWLVVGYHSCWVEHLISECLFCILSVASLLRQSSSSALDATI